MRNLLMTTLLASALGAGLALAQTAPSSQSGTEVTVPEGYVRQDIVLTAEQLLGATVYDVQGESIGDVHDLVLDSAAEQMGADQTGSGAATDGSTATNTATGGGTTTGSTATDGAANGSATTTGTTGTAEASGSGGNLADGTITHAIVDVGGFLGMGEHRVAVPTSDLAVYRSDNELRIYLPWTREQLEAVPQYIEGDTSTLGQSTLPPVN